MSELVKPSKRRRRKQRGGRGRGFATLLPHLLTTGNLGAGFYAIVTAPSALSATLSATLRALSAALGPRPAAAALRLRRGGGGVESLEGRRGHRAVAPRRPRGRAQHGPRAGPSADSGASDSSAAGESREDGAVGDGIVRAIGSVRPEGRRRRGG